MKKVFYPLVTITLLSASCRETAFLTPLNHISHYYRTIPLHSDSVKNATYANALLTLGNGNRILTDDFYSFQAGANRSFNFGNFQGYFGGDMTLGNYQLNPSDFPNSTNNGLTSKFFGAYGFNAAVNYVMPFDRGEWRVIGLETSFQNEFGDYLQFRKTFPPENALIVQTADWIKTLGVYTEFAWKVGHNKIFGYRLAAGGTFTSPKNYLGSDSTHTPGYFSNTFRLSSDYITGFLQMNTGTYAFSMQLGMNFNISKHRKNNQQTE